MLRVSRIESAGTDQDRVLALPTEAGVLLAVSDGAGGWGDGARAAERVIEGLKRCAGGSSAIWMQTLQALDAELARANIGEATAVVVEATETHLRGASVGDSAAFTLTGATVEEITRHQRRKPLLGAGDARIVAFELEAWSGRLLLVSDGIVKYVPRAELPALAATGSMADEISELVRRARLPSGGLQDDLAIVLCERG
jgi:PPM family protein phosphatase